MTALLLKYWREAIIGALVLTLVGITWGWYSYPRVEKVEVIKEVEVIKVEYRDRVIKDNSIVRVVAKETKPDGTITISKSETLVDVKEEVKLQTVSKVEEKTKVLSTIEFKDRGFLLGVSSKPLQRVIPLDVTLGVRVGELVSLPIYVTLGGQTQNFTFDTISIGVLTLF